MGGNRAHPYPGRLIVVEGLDGSGKSTQLSLARRWLEAEDFPVFFTEWNSSEVVSRATREAKQQRTLTPLTFSLIHAADFAERYENRIVPHLKTGYVVLADRYVYTAYARDVARNLPLGWVRDTYAFADQPAAALYFQLPVDVAVDRILRRGQELKFHEAGMDLGLSPDIVTSFRMFQARIKHQYDAMTDSEGLTVVDATLTVEEQQKTVRRAIRSALAGYAPPPHVVRPSSTLPEGGLWLERP